MITLAIFFYAFRSFRSVNAQFTRPFFAFALLIPRNGKYNTRRNFEIASIIGNMWENVFPLPTNSPFSWKCLRATPYKVRHQKHTTFSHIKLEFSLHRPSIHPKDEGKRTKTAYFKMCRFQEDLSEGRCFFFFHSIMYITSIFFHIGTVLAQRDKQSIESFQSNACKIVYVLCDISAKRKSHFRLTVKKSLHSRVKRFLFFIITFIV